MSESGELRVCKKCLLSEMTKEAYYQNLQDYLEELEPERKSSQELYEKRLERCKECEKLINGLCRACGCYVEMRAAISENKCPCQYW